MTESSLKNLIENIKKKHPNDIIVVSGTGCPRCRTLKKFLEKNNLSYKELLIDSATIGELKEANITAIPTVIFRDQIMIDPSMIDLSSLK